MHGWTDGWDENNISCPSHFCVFKIEVFIIIFYYLKHGLLQEGEIRNIVYTVEPGHVVTSIKPVSKGHLFLVLS